MFHMGWRWWVKCVSIRWVPGSNALHRLDLLLRSVSSSLSVRLVPFALPFPSAFQVPPALAVASRVVSFTPGSFLCPCSSAPLCTPLPPPLSPYFATPTAD